jgi:chromosome segregation ATPase
MSEFSRPDTLDTSGLVGNSFSEALAEEFDKAGAAARRLYAAMTPLEKAQHDLDNATRNLQKGMEDESTSASELARLKAAVAAAAARQAAEEENLERATKGVTEAMVEQADAARARVDSAYGYQKALLDQQQAMIDVTEAETALNEARASGDPKAIAQAELDYKSALLGVNDALGNRVKLASEVAISKLPAAMADEHHRRGYGSRPRHGGVPPVADPDHR